MTGFWSAFGGNCARFDSLFFPPIFAPAVATLSDTSGALHNDMTRVFVFLCHSFGLLYVVPPMHFKARILLPRLAPLSVASQGLRAACASLAAASCATLAYTLCRFCGPGGLPGSRWLSPRVGVHGVRLGCSNPGGAVVPERFVEHRYVSHRYPFYYCLTHIEIHRGGRYHA